MFLIARPVEVAQGEGPPCFPIEEIQQEFFLCFCDKLDGGELA